MAAVRRALEEDAIRNAVFISFVLYECQGAHDATFFSSACLWAAPSIRSPVHFKPKRKPWRGSKGKRLFGRGEPSDDNKSPAQVGGLRLSESVESSRHFPTSPYFADLRCPN
jgi:hypothetical protein